eukprot:gene4253-4303_t
MLGLVGESGCGKTTLARALMGVLPGNARIASGTVRLDGTDLVGLSPSARRARLWREISFIPQSAMNALDPVYRLRAQMREILCRRGGMTTAAADARAAEMFRAVLARPAHPYTMGLMNAFPDLEGPEQLLAPIQGSPPDLHSPPSGCRFAARCPFALDLCRTTDPACVEIAGGHQAAYLELTPLVAVTALEKTYRVGRTAAQILRGQRPVLRAVDQIDFSLQRGESVGLVGESGSGKTTVGRVLLKLTEPSAGAVMFDGTRLDTLSGARLRRFRQQAQLVFQNPFDAINPRFTIRATIAEPLINTGIPRSEHPDRIAAAIAAVHLGDPATILDKPGHPYTKALIQAVPRPDTDQSRADLPITGGLGDPVNPPSGCRLRDRCPHAFARCATEIPPLKEIAPGHLAACHLHG